MKLPLSKIADFISAPGDFPREELALGYSIDSRTVSPGELFFAVKGERLDGHDFVDAALERGAISAVIRKDQLHRFSGALQEETVDFVATAHLASVHRQKELALAHIDARFG